MHLNGQARPWVPVRLRGSLVRDLRIRKGFATQAVLALAMGCGKSTVKGWESSRHLPRPENLTRLAELLGVPATCLVETTDPECSGVLTLRDMRVSAGFRQADIAAALNLRGTGSYSDVERGRQGIPARWLPVLSRILGEPEEVILASPRGPAGKNRTERLS
ncbi:helix-turn-helix domain-containing protein [Streptomyces sp. NPDC088557]|uniref:helix-turn-helix domain-containing protein n=1 Tax=Streptomyces sp. NPDC088557 TaxID=3365867 RepID=UPI0038112C6E